MSHSTQPFYPASCPQGCEQRVESKQEGEKSVRGNQVMIATGAARVAKIPRYDLALRNMVHGGRGLSVHQTHCILMLCYASRTCPSTRAWFYKLLVGEFIPDDRVSLYSRIVALHLERCFSRNPGEKTKKFPKGCREGRNSEGLAQFNFTWIAMDTLYPKTTIGRRAESSQGRCWESINSSSRPWKPQGVIWHITVRYRPPNEAQCMPHLYHAMH